MATTIRFREHEEFQRAALHMTLFGALAGASAWLAGQLVPSFGPPGGAWALATLAAAAAFGASAPARHTRGVELVLLGLVALAIGVALTMSAASARAETVGGAALALGFGVLVARGGRRFGVTLLAAGATAVLCRMVYANLLHAAGVAAVPAWIAAVATGGAFAFVGVLGLLPRHVDLGRDRVAEALAASQGVLVGELRDLADRAAAVWRKVDGSAPPDAPVRKSFEDAVLRLFEVGRRWAAVEADGARTSAEVLAQRMEAMTEKMTRTEDPVARGQYAQAHAALAEQARYLKEIGAARERVVARMHHYLAAMERLRFAVINHRSADASRLATEVQPILDDLSDLGRDIDSSSEALAEVERAGQEMK
jgi:hypothetical protein